MVPELRIRDMRAAYHFQGQVLSASFDISAQSRFILVNAFMNVWKFRVFNFAVETTPRHWPNVPILTTTFA